MYSCICCNCFIFPFSFVIVIVFLVHCFTNQGCIKEEIEMFFFTVCELLQKSNEIETD